MHALSALAKFETNTPQRRSHDRLALALEGMETAEGQAALREVQQATPSIDRASFEWIDGLLIDSLREGKWLVLDNANLCSPSVLDRLNSLLEPNGVLLVNEIGNLDGTPEVIRPHPDFRIFLTLDPRYGELSRAMRNRAVELHVPGRHAATTMSWDGAVFTESALGRFRPTKAVASLAQQIDDPEDLLRIVIDHTGIQDEYLRPRFERQIRSGLCSHPELFENLHTRSRRLSNDHEAKLYNFYLTCISQLQVPADFANVQVSRPAFIVSSIIG